jgi:hypothetical protein
VGVIAKGANSRMRGRVKLVKRQLNGDDHVVLKADASADDLKAEAARLKKELGYQVQLDKRRGGYLATHAHFRGKFLLALEQD